MDWSLEGGEARYALSWCSWRFLWARLSHSKFRLVFGSTSLRMIVLFIIHDLEKLVVAKSHLPDVIQGRISSRTIPKTTLFKF